MATLFQPLQLQHPFHHSSSSAFQAVTSSLPPRIDRTTAGPLLIKTDEPYSITVDVIGRPQPEVTWHLGRRHIRDSSKYHVTSKGSQHILTVTRVSEELEKGIWIRANNDSGEDNCAITVKTYNVLAGQRFSIGDGMRQVAPAPEIVLRRSATCQLRRPVSDLYSDDNQSAMSVPYAILSHDDWSKEMAARNRMRSVDDLQHYKVWHKTDDVTSSSGRRRRRLVSARRTSRSDVSNDERRLVRSSSATDCSKTPTRQHVSRASSAADCSNTQRASSAGRRRRQRSSSRDSATDVGLKQTMSSSAQFGGSLNVQVLRPRKTVTSVDKTESCKLPPSGRTTTRTSRSSTKMKTTVDVFREDRLERTLKSQRVDAGRVKDDGELWRLFGVHLGTLCRQLIQSPTLSRSNTQDIDAKKYRAVDVGLDQHIDNITSTAVVDDTLTSPTRHSPMSAKVEFKTTVASVYLNGDGAITANGHPPSQTAFGPDVNSDIVISENIAKETVTMVAVDENVDVGDSRRLRDTDSVDAILSQTVDLQKILVTIDQLIGNSDSVRAIEQHHPTLEPPPVAPVLTRQPDVVIPTTVIKRGGVVVHSDDEDDDTLELDDVSHYGDTLLSMALDLGAQMLATATDNEDDDDDFDSAQYERDAEIKDIDPMTLLSDIAVPVHLL